MNITIFGIGYVGLVQAAALADVGHDIVCVDIDSEKINRLKQGVIPIFEPGLESMVKRNHAAGRLAFTDDAAQGVAHGNVLMIAVGTPPNEDGSADLSYVLAVAATIARHMDRPALIVSKSTVPVGTCDRIEARVAEILAERNQKNLRFHVVSNPEFLKEGSAVADCMKPDRIIVGTGSEEAKQVMREIYAPFNRNHEKIVVMSVRSAELTKYAANCILATKISFMNEMANLAEQLGADIEEVRHGIGSDPRIGYHFIYPGLGYGGSCFPKDVRALIRTAEETGFEPKILNAVELRNEEQKSILFRKIDKFFNSQLAGKTFALWGLAFKPDTDDMREAPSRTLMEALWAAGARVQAYDPEAMQECRRIYGQRADLTLCPTKEHALQGADALLIATEWKSFRAPPFDLVRNTLSSPVIFDGRNLYDPVVVTRHGLHYESIGRAPAGASCSAADE